MDTNTALLVHYNDRTANFGKVELVGSRIINFGILDPESVITVDSMVFFEDNMIECQQEEKCDLELLYLIVPPRFHDHQ